MSAIRQDLFGDGSVTAEYYPHKRMELRLDDLKVVVAKPYGMIYSGVLSGKTNVAPVIQLSSNNKVYLTLNSLQLLNRAILTAVQILNSENDGIIIEDNFEKNYNYTSLNKNNLPANVQAAHKQSVSEGTKSIPYKEIRQDRVYEDIRGHQWIYLGTGTLYSKDNRGVHRENRSGCNYVYIDMDEVNECPWSLNSGIIVTTKTCPLAVDTFASKKRFVKVVSKFNEPVRGVSTPYSDFYFCQE
jgi:hypothetical protein